MQPSRLQVPPPLLLRFLDLALELVALAPGDVGPVQLFFTAFASVQKGPTYGPLAGHRFRFPAAGAAAAATRAGGKLDPRTFSEASPLEAVLLVVTSVPEQQLQAALAELATMCSSFLAWAENAKQAAEYEEGACS